MPACLSCGFESDQAFRFCPECGAEPAAAPTLEQRKRSDRAAALDRYERKGNLVSAERVQTRLADLRDAAK